MNILETVLQAAGGSAVDTLAKSFDLSGIDAGAVIGQLVPALARGMQRNTQKPEGLDSLISALTKGSHDRYVQNPGELAQRTNVQDGDKILGHLFGNKDVSREVARRASNNTGVSSSIIKKMLPMIASLAMGAMSSKTREAGISNADSPGVGSLVGGFLDADGDGSIADDLLGLATRALS